MQHPLAQLSGGLIAWRVLVEMEWLAETNRDGRPTKKPVAPIVGGPGTIEEDRQHGHVRQPGDGRGTFLVDAVAVSCSLFGVAQAALREDDDAFARFESAYGLTNPIALIKNGVSDEWLAREGDGKRFRETYSIPADRRMP